VKRVVVVVVVGSVGVEALVVDRDEVVSELLDSNVGRTGLDRLIVDTDQNSLLGLNGDDTSGAL